MYNIVFHGEFETKDKNSFIQGLEKLAKETNTVIRGNFKIHEFVEFEMIEDSDVEILDNNVENQDDSSTNISNRD
jgi:septum formation topological specificity factor MinE